VKTLLKLLAIGVFLVPGLSMAGTIILSTTTYNYDYADTRILRSPDPLGLLELEVDWGGPQTRYYSSYNSEVGVRYLNAIKDARFYDYVNSKTYSLVGISDLLTRGLTWQRLRDELETPGSTGYYQSGLSANLNLVDELGVVSSMWFFLESYKDPEIAEDLIGALTRGINAMNNETMYGIDGKLFSEAKFSVRMPEPSIILMFLTAFALLMFVRYKNLFQSVRSSSANQSLA
jgi:hypothetical protein